MTADLADSAARGQTRVHRNHRSDAMTPGAQPRVGYT